ncbi:MAG: hypothetical protein VW270_29995 [Candidatus Poseidoniales archaeon]
MTLNHDITIIRNCTTSPQLFSVVETFAYQVSELEDRLKRAEYAYDWDAIESALEQLAVKRYVYKFAYDAASDMEEDEWQYQNELEINNAMMGDRV